MPPLLAKPSGVLLRDHVRHLDEQCDQIFPLRPFVCRKYRRLTGSDLEPLVRLGVKWHDEGKRHSQWQTACRRDHEEFLESCRAAWAQEPEDRRPEFAAFCRGRRAEGRHILKAGIRHEVASLQILRRMGENLPLVVRVAIGAHHGKFGHRHADRWQEFPGFEELWKEFCREGKSIRLGEPGGFERAVRKRYAFAGPRALLQLADHRASALEGGEPPPPLRLFDYQFPHGKRRGVQNLIPLLHDEPFAILRAPTGAGKTDAALLWAQRQIEQDRADRLVIAMPTRFTANALSIATASTLSATGLYHSSALYQRRKDRGEVSPEEQRRIREEQNLARLLETPVTVTTLDHLCIALTGTREDHHAIFFNLAHSCVVIDEADFYDDFTQGSIEVLLRALHLLEVPVLLMSATVPDAARVRYTQATGFRVEVIHEDAEDANHVRPRCRIAGVRRAEGPEDVADFLQRALDGEPTLIYANTVRRAQAYYRWLRKRGCRDLVLYHSRFREPHKAAIEDKLYSLLGKKAWEQGTARGVAVLTQIGELSVNISADLMISDVCPADRQAQRIGRLSRFQERGDGKAGVVGELYLIEPLHPNRAGEREFYPAPYGRYVQGKGWEASPALEISRALLTEGVYSARCLVELVEKVYPEAPDEPGHVRDNRIRLEDCAVGNWLIVPYQDVSESDDRTMEWRCRDIPPQYTLYAGYRLNPFAEDAGQWFPNWSRFREFQIEHGIQCHAHEFRRACEHGFLEEVPFRIGEDHVEPCYLVRPDFYRFDEDWATGLDFPFDEEEE